MQLTNQRLDHRCLQSIANSRAGAREQADPQVRAQRRRDRNEDVDAGLHQRSLDPRKVALVDACCRSKRFLRDSGLPSKLEDLGANMLTGSALTPLKLSETNGQSGLGHV